MERNQEKISNLVMDMLSFSKDREPIMEPAELNQVVGEVVELMQVRADELNVHLAWSPDPKMPSLLFDAHGLHRAILNVVTNAIDACEQVEMARVEVNTHYDLSLDEAVITIKDNGQGIPEEDLQRIFSVFESKKGSRGTGLGLPVSQKILKEHQGDISVESEPGHGSQFTMYFPAQLSDGFSGGETMGGQTLDGN